jgi:hypothetical protein
VPGNLFSKENGMNQKATSSSVEWQSSSITETWTLFHHI